MRNIENALERLLSFGVFMAYVKKIMQQTQIILSGFCVAYCRLQIFKYKLNFNRFDLLSRLTKYLVQICIQIQFYW